MRGIVLTRLTGMVEGNSGVRPELARAVAGMLESGPLPTVPSQGNGGSGEIIAARPPLRRALVAHRRGLARGDVADQRLALRLGARRRRRALGPQPAGGGRARLRARRRGHPHARRAAFAAARDALGGAARGRGAALAARAAGGRRSTSGATSRRPSRSASCRACSAACAARPPRPSARRPPRSRPSATTPSSCRPARATRSARRSRTAATTTPRRRRRWTGSRRPGPTSASCSSARPSAC